MRGHNAGSRNLRPTFFLPSLYIAFRRLRLCDSANARLTAVGRIGRPNNKRSCDFDLDRPSVCYDDDKGASIYDLFSRGGGENKEGCVIINQLPPVEKGGDGGKKIQYPVGVINRSRITLIPSRNFAFRGLAPPPRSKQKFAKSDQRIHEITFQKLKLRSRGFDRDWNEINQI